MCELRSTDTLIWFSLAIEPSSPMRSTTTSPTSSCWEFVKLPMQPSA